MQLLDIVKKDSSDRSVVIRIIDSTTGLPETAVEHNTSGIDLWYRREGAAKTSITEAALADLETAHTDGGIEAIGDGAYRLDLPDAAFATGANYVDVGGTVTGMIVIGGRVRLVDFDLESETVDVGLWKGSAPADLVDTDKVSTSTQHMAANVMTASAAASDFGAELAALIETYIVNEGDATAVMQAIADVIAQDWIAGDATPLAIVAALKADAEWSNIATLAAELAKVPKSDGTVTWNATALASINAEADTAISDASLATASELATVKQNIAYPEGFVYAATNGASGTTVYTNGTFDNPSDSLADAKAIAASYGTNAIKLKPRGTIFSGNFAADAVTLADGGILDVNGNYLTTVDNITPPTNGFEIVQSSLMGGSLVGTTWTTGQGGYYDNIVWKVGTVVVKDQVRMKDCIFPSATTLDITTSFGLTQPPSLYGCEFVGELSVEMANAHSSQTVIIDYSSGDVTVKNLVAGQTVRYEGWGTLTIAATCTGGTVEHSSHVEINDLASGAVTESLVSSAASDSSIAAATKTAMEADGSKLDHLWEMTEDDSGTRRFTTNALEQAPSGGGGGGDATEAKQDAILEDLEDIKGTDFVKDTNSLVNLSSGSAVNVHTENVNIISEDS